MSEVYLLVTSGGGPEECRIAVGHTVNRIRKEADLLGLDVSVSDETKSPASTIVMIDGQNAQSIVRSWSGTILWRQKSPIRKNHRRASWFIGVYELPGHGQMQNELTEVPREEVRFSTFRAGGPGGQHQNTTDSAVRAEWKGFVAVSRDERSQHRNKSKALARLNHLLRAARNEAVAEGTRAEHCLHRSLERGNPKRSFTGPDFVET
ncbi:peptide chain release factor-like protein [Pseudosulfitobacter pseudonitzschiae]|uniref:peptide chain release factor-like protein n=1 Tax=Pseudosulfitobacter pseudonitzschiae TaxID=1402135 RepID=UPI003B7BD296